MHKEYESIMINDVWEVVLRPEDKSLVTSKWLYKIKHGANEVLKSRRKDLLLEASLKRKA